MAGRYWGEAVIVALALLLWVPRLSGPIDLRWDAGVYYVLGTSLATGQGYRILSEPGSPEAVQYPPLLPAIVALHQWMLGTTNPDVVAPWLRKFNAAVFVLFALAALTLARRYLALPFALLAVALCLANPATLFVSEFLYAEMLFGLASILFVLVLTNDRFAARPWLREALSFLLITAGFLLRTAGVALSGAWVLDSLLRCQWRLALTRGLLAIIPVMIWQAHIARVRESYEYAHPTYQYQRAPYLFYNVSYAETVVPPGSDHADWLHGRAAVLAARVINNIPRIAERVGEAVSTSERYWRQLLWEVQQRALGQQIIPARLLLVPILSLPALVVAGMAVLIYRGAWLVPLLIITSLALISTTTWKGEFPRYLVPLAPFLTISAILALVKIYGAVRAARVGHASRTVAQIAIAGFLLLTLLVQIYSVTEIFRLRQSEGASFVAGRGVVGSPFFLHDPLWRGWEQAVGWIDQHASADAIVATAYSHLCYLRTGRRAVSPPLESDPTRARQLLESVPVSYVIVDRGYSLPAIEGDAEG